MTDLLSKVKKKLSDLNIKYDSVNLSDRPNKKIRIMINGKVIHFGAKNSVTFIIHGDKKKEMLILHDILKSY